MNYSEYVPYVEPVGKKPSLSFSMWYRFKCICDTIRHRIDMRNFEQTRIKNAKKVISVNIVGMDLEDARKKLPNITIRDYGMDKTEAYCNGRCNVYVDENNIITKIVDFG
jgi:hypothetical protein